MVMVLCVSVVAVPVPTQSNLTHRSSNPLPHYQSHQLLALRLAVPSSTPSVRPITPTSPPSTPALSLKTATAKTTVIPTAHSKVEDYAKKLRAEMESQERVLNIFINTIRTKHSNAEMNLKKVKAILKGLKDEINNATKYANQYQAQDTDLSKQDTLYKVEYEKSRKMYDDEHSNIKFEKQFLEEIIKYIQLRKTQKC
jgi:hypothetical protein